MDTLGVWDQNDDGLAGTNEVGLWDPAGMLVASVAAPARAMAVLEDSLRWRPTSRSRQPAVPYRGCVSSNGRFVQKSGHSRRGAPDHRFSGAWRLFAEWRVFRQ